MKKFSLILAVLALAGIAQAAQKSDATVKEVRNPRTLAAIVNANAADAESRLTSGSTSASNLTLIGQADTATAEVYLKADMPLGASDDAGDFYAIVATDGAGLSIQSDVSSKGTLAQKALIGNDGLISSAVGIDAIGNVDFDIGSADMDDCTVTTDGGTVILDGVITSSDDITSGNDIVAGGDATITSNATVGGTLAVTGVATFTAESVHNLGIDADYITVDAAAGIDTKSAGTLVIGESTATKVEIADTGVETEIEGALDCISTLAVGSTSLFSGNARIAANADLTATVDAGTSTNTLVSNGVLAGAHVSGNIPVASVTNALSGYMGSANFTNQFLGDSTNVNEIIVINGLITSWTTGN